MTPRMKVYELPLTHQEMHVILRALAIANDSTWDRDASKKEDSYPRTWIAERIIKLIEREASDDQG